MADRRESRALLKLDSLPPEILQRILREVLLGSDKPRDPLRVEEEVFRGVPCRIDDEGLPERIEHPVMYTCKALRREATAMRFDVAVFCASTLGQLQRFNERFKHSEHKRKEMAFYVDVADVAPSVFATALGTTAAPRSPSALRPWLQTLRRCCEEPMLHLYLGMVFQDFVALSALAREFSFLQLKHAPILAFSFLGWFQFAESTTVTGQTVIFNVTAWLQEATLATLHGKALPPIGLTREENVDALRQDLINRGVTGFAVESPDPAA